MPKWNEIYNGAIMVARGLAGMGLPQAGILISREDGETLERELSAQCSFYEITAPRGVKYRAVDIAGVHFRWPAD